TGVTDNAVTVPAQVQTLLRREYGLDVNVINLSARGFVSLQELLVLNQCLAEQNFDMVISVSGYNDLMRFLKGDPHPSYVMRSNSDAVVLVRRVEAGNLVITNVVPALRRISQTANLVALVMEKRREKAKENWKAAKEELAAKQRNQEAPKKGPSAPKGNRESAKADHEIQKRKREGPKQEPSAPSPKFLGAHLANYAMMNTICEVHHTYFKLFFQPSVFTKANFSAEEKERLLRKDCSGSQDKLDAMTLAHRTYRAAFDAVPKPFPFTDLSGAFGQTDTQIYLDGCHYNEDGSTQLARVIAADLAPIIRSRLATPKPQP
ncbi:MAG: hypothetical protein ABI680_03520, partial [Chthoniobacteraceae bacterium]